VNTPRSGPPSGRGCRTPPLTPRGDGGIVEHGDALRCGGSTDSSSAPVIRARRRARTETNAGTEPPRTRAVTGFVSPHQVYDGRSPGPRPSSRPVHLASGMDAGSAVRAPSACSHAGEQPATALVEAPPARRRPPLPLGSPTSVRSARAVDRRSRNSGVRCPSVRRRVLPIADHRCFRRRRRYFGSVTMGHRRRDRPGHRGACPSAASNATGRRLAERKPAEVAPGGRAGLPDRRPSLGSEPTTLSSPERSHATAVCRFRTGHDPRAARRNRTPYTDSRYIE
jgi:hypothetical protein